MHYYCNIDILGVHRFMLYKKIGISIDRVADMVEVEYHQRYLSYYINNITQSVQNHDLSEVGIYIYRPIYAFKISIDGLI